MAARHVPKGKPVHAAEARGIHALVTGLPNGYVVYSNIELQTGQRGQTYEHDAVVVDAPPTGRVTRFLNVNREVAGIARVGPIRSQADSVMRVITSSQTAVHLVTLLEEMPVQETIDGVEALHENGLPPGEIIVNMLRDPLMTTDELSLASSGGLSRDLLIADLKKGGVVSRRGATTTALVDDLADEARDHAERVALEAQERERLESLGLPVISLPLLDQGVDLAGLYELAAALREQGLR